MSTSEQYFSLVRTSKSSWIAVPANQTAKTAEDTSYLGATDATILRSSVSARMFAQASGARAKFSERFPRLTIAMIALGLFTVSVTAEVELLRHAGYFWR
jgi:hypothetical protein